MGIKLPLKKEKKENTSEDTRMKSKAWDPMRFQTMATKNILGNVLSIKVLMLATPVFSYYSWGSQGKSTEVVCHSLLQWTTFCQTSPT